MWIQRYCQEFLLYLLQEIFDNQLFQFLFSETKVLLAVSEKKYDNIFINASRVIKD